MSKRRKILATLLVSSQLLAVMPVHGHDSQPEPDDWESIEEYQEEEQRRQELIDNSDNFSDETLEIIDNIHEELDDGNWENAAYLLLTSLNTEDVDRYIVDQHWLRQEDNDLMNAFHRLVNEGSNSEVRRLITYAGYVSGGYNLEDGQLSAGGQASHREPGYSYFVLEAVDILDGDNQDYAEDVWGTLEQYVRVRGEIGPQGDPIRLVVRSGPERLEISGAWSDVDVDESQFPEQPDPEEEWEGLPEVEHPGRSDRRTPDPIERSDINDREYSNTRYEFDEETGRRYRVTTTTRIVNGERTTEESREVDAEGLTSLWSDRRQELFTGTATMTESEWDEVEEEEESNLTLQYSLNSDDEFPVYTDTGLFADVNGNVEYSDLYEAMYQIAINVENGYLVEDSDKLLVVAEGQPVYIIDQEETYSQEEVEALFEDFETVDLLVAETRIGTTDSLEWQLRTGQSQTVTIDGEEIELNTPPAIRGERVVLPIVEIFEAVGGVIEEDEDSISVEYDGTSIVFEDGVSEASVDSELIELGAPIERNEQGEFTANVMPVFTEIGIENIWDEEDSTLLLNNTLREVETEDESENEETNDADENENDEE